MSTTVPVWTLGDRLRKARLMAGLHQRDVAEYLGLSSGAVGMYELDVRQPKLGVLRLWAMRCGVPLEWLQSGDDGELRGRDSNSQPNGLAAVVQLRIPA